MRGDISPVGSAAGWRDLGAPDGWVIQPGAPCVQAVLGPPLMAMYVFRMLTPPA
jgi:hypothetical protein